jgi:hypothetical protein
LREKNDFFVVENLEKDLTKKKRLPPPQGRAWGLVVERGVKKNHKNLKKKKIRLFFLAPKGGGWIRGPPLACATISD